MALGNNISIGQARGKNKPVAIKRSKERYDARDFHAISGSTVESGDAAACALGSTPNTYYHNGSSAGGYTTNDYVYTRKRASNVFYLPNGYYKVTDGGGTFKSIQILNGKIRSTPSTCR